ncbi:aminoglycoside phosphotransferase family protein [Enemella sp. A6]|uniref:aminoglycoside phosphotransferase family protein n=1 Tax=Enemella sp. A6 TaxID=3440152 RepID=UPI003EB9060B
MTSSGSPHPGRLDLIPDDLRTRMTGRPADDGIAGDKWLATLPRLLSELLEDWQLTVDGPSRSGHTAVVVPVRRDDEPLVLKVVWPHVEGRAEHVALQRWGGGAAVRLVRADPSRGALLLERLDADRDLTEVWIDEACEVIGGLLGELHRDVGPEIPRLTDWLDERLAALSSARLPRRVIERAHGLYRELAPSSGSSLLHTDLHFENVLWREHDQRWVAIDPQPLAGAPGFELHPLLRNRIDELGTGAGFRWSVRRRIEVVCEAAGIDEEVAKGWTMIHAAVKAMWATEVAGSGAKDTVTFNLTLQKALED